MNNPNRHPLVHLIWLTLRSRRVLTAVAALLVGALVSAAPALEAVEAELLTLVITLALALIGGYSMEDAVRASRSQPREEEVRELTKAVLTALVNELDARQQQSDERQPDKPPSG